MADDEEDIPESAGGGGSDSGGSKVELEPWSLERVNYGYDNPFRTFAFFVKERFTDYVLEHAALFGGFATSPSGEGDFLWRSNFPTITYEREDGSAIGPYATYQWQARRTPWQLDDLFRTDALNHWVRPATIGAVTDYNSGFVAYLDEDETRVNVVEDGYEYSEGEGEEGLRVHPVKDLYVGTRKIKLPHIYSDGGIVPASTPSIAIPSAASPAISWEDRGLDNASFEGIAGGAYEYSECSPFHDFKRLLISFRDNLSFNGPTFQPEAWRAAYYADSDHWNRTPFVAKYPLMTTRKEAPGTNSYAPGFIGIPDDAMGPAANPPRYDGALIGPDPGSASDVLDSKQLNGLIRSTYYLYLALNSEESLEDPMWTQYYLAEFLLAFTNMGSLEPHFNDHLCVPTSPGGLIRPSDPFDPVLDFRIARTSEFANVQKFVGALPLLGGATVGSLDELGLETPGSPAAAADWPKFTRAEYNTPIFDYVNDLLAPAEEEHPGLVWSMLNFLSLGTPEDIEFTAEACVGCPPGELTETGKKYTPVENTAYHLNPGQSHAENSVKWSLETWMSYLLSVPTIDLSDTLHDDLIASWTGVWYGGDQSAATWNPDHLIDEELYGIPSDSYEELLDQGLVLKPCDPSDEPFQPEECPPCIPNPEALVPNWRDQEDGVVFFNQRSCEYCVTTVSGETDATIVNDEVAREAFLNVEKERGIDLILQNFEKYPVNEETRDIIREYSVVKEYDIPLRPLLPLRALVCVDVNVINAIELLNPVEEEIVAPPIEPIGCVLMAQEIRTMIKKANEAFRYYGHKYALWSHDTGLTIPNFDPDEERRKLRIFVPVLVTLMGRNGFKLNGKGAAEKIEFRFNKNYQITYAEANEPGCPPVELIWAKGGDNLGGFKAFEPINDPRTMAYLSKLPDIVNDAGARDPKAWDEFFTKYTYPEISTNEVVDPIGDPVMADGPLQQAAQSIVNDIVGLEDAIVAKFSQAVCRDREGKEEFDADIRDFDDMLRRAAHAKTRNLKIGDNTFINLAEILAESGSIDELYHGLLNKLGECGWLDLLGTAFACLSKGMDLEVSLGIILKAALKGMDPGNLEKIFIGLPPDKQMEIKQKIAEAGWGNIPAPWEAGYRPGNYAYDVETDEDGNPIPESHSVANPSYGVEGDPTAPDPYITIEAENDERDIAERTAQYRREASDSFGSRTSASFGGAGSVGMAANKTVTAILEVYADAILDSVDFQYLLKELGKFPGGELVAKILMNPDCPAPPLFNPPLNEFMKTLELDFCRKHIALTWPKFKKIRIPDFLRMLMEALLQAIMELAVKILMTILELILKLLLSGLCNLLGLLGDLVTGLFENQPSNQFADAIQNAVSTSGLNDLGAEVLADEEAINQAAADLFGAFSRSCTNPEDLPDSNETASFLRDVGIILTQGEFIDLLRGEATTEVVGAVHQLVLIIHKKFLCIMPSASDVSGFFTTLGSMLSPEFLMSLLQDSTPSIPVFPSVCSGVSGAEDINNLRRALLLKKGLDESLVDEQLESLRCRAVTDLEQLADIMQNGPFGDFPPIMDDYSDPKCPIRGFMPRDPNPELVPGSPTATLIGQQGVFAGMFDILEKVYYDDIMGRGGFINMILSDKDGRSLRAHHMFVAAQSLFGIFGGKANTHQMLLPDTIGNYLKNALQYPSVEMNSQNPGIAFQSPGSRLPNLELQYCNYYPINHPDSYYFSITGELFDQSASTLNNSYELTLTEAFNEDFKTSGTTEDGVIIDEVDAEDETIITTSFSGDPALPPGVEDFIELELGLDIENAIERVRELDASGITAQSVVFGEYIKKILEENIDPAFAGMEHTEARLDSISQVCAKDIHNYVSSQFFDLLMKVITQDNQAFIYGEGGSDFLGNEPITYSPKKIDLDTGHTHPVTGDPVPLDPLAWGGNTKHPAYYEQPPQNRPGWCGIADQLIPEVDACEPARKNVVRYDDIVEKITNEFYMKIADDDRAGGASCLIEEPCNKILSREASSMIEGNLRATIRVYAVEAYLKGAPTFLKFKVDPGEVYGDPLKAYITQTLKEGFFRYSKKGFGRRKNDEYYFQILEQAVQNFGKKIDAGLVEPTQEEQEAIDTINSLQGIWMQDTSPGSGKIYADTGERLKRVLSPGYFGAVVRNIFTDKSLDIESSDKAVLNARNAQKLKEASWDAFMREVEGPAEVILKRYIEEELKYISDEFSSRIPPKYRTLYEVLLGGKMGPSGMFGAIPFMADGSILPGLGPLQETPFQVANNAVHFPVQYEPGDTTIVTVSEQNTFLRLTEEASRTGASDASPLSRAFGGTRTSSEERPLTSYFPFMLETYIFIEDLTGEHWANLYYESGIPTTAGEEAELRELELLSEDPESEEIVALHSFWESTIMTRPSHLFGVVKATEWKAYLDSMSTEFAGYIRSDLWAQWSYGLRIVFIPPHGADVPSGWTYPPDSLRQSIIEIYTEFPGIPEGVGPFTEATIQNNKAFSFGSSGLLPLEVLPGETPPLPTLPNPLVGLADPMSIPVASATLPINMTVAADDAVHNWTTANGYDDSGGYLELVQRLVCGPEYQMLFRYCFNMPRVLSTIAIYMIQAFVPSIGRANPDGAKSPGLFIATDDPLTDVPAGGFSHDGWYAPGSILFGADREYHGGGLGLSPFALNFKRWDHLNSFKRSKKTLAQTFMDLYNSNDPSYNSDSFDGEDTERDARDALNVTWPKFMFRLRQKKVDRPYNKDGDICFDPDDDYSD